METTQHHNMSNKNRILTVVKTPSDRILYNVITDSEKRARKSAKDFISITSYKDNELYVEVYKKRTNKWTNEVGYILIRAYRYNPKKGHLHELKIEPHL